MDERLETLFDYQSASADATICELADEDFLARAVQSKRKEDLEFWDAVYSEYLRGEGSI